MYNTAAERSICLSIDQNVRSGIRVLVLGGEIDADTVGLLREAMRIDGRESSKLVLDLGAVTFLDSSAINVLALANRHATAAGGWLRMAALTSPVQRVVELVGLDTIIMCYPTLPEALADAV
ncbi:STAS domain-containing protein [Streptomyces sp. NPDC005244]|uniref:STAS domain-containing protein n=1 Tax=Streptomyces sp. NPDC005244 TaxID=3364708 RepID=UPI0036799E42